MLLIATQYFFANNFLSYFDYKNVENQVLPSNKQSTNKVEFYYNILNILYFAEQIIVKNICHLWISLVNFIKKKRHLCKSSKTFFSSVLSKNYSIT